ncbi:MAG: rane protein [Marmoricola sp.]|nr:rane protein [Marmoricola sp.]
MSRVAVALAVVLLPLGLLSVWFSTVLADNDRYVAAVAPLADDPAVQQAVIGTLTEAAVTVFDSTPDPGPCRNAGTPGEPALDGFSDLANAVMPLAEAPIRSVVTGIVSRPLFATAWTGANRSAHQQLVAVLGGDDSHVEDGCISLDLTAVLTEAVPELNGIGGLSFVLPDRGTPVASIATADLRTARVGYALLKPLGIGLPVLWLSSCVVALALSRRRWRTTWVLGALSVLATVLLLVGLSETRSSLAGASGDPALARALWDAVASSIRTQAVVALVAAAAATAAGVSMSVRGQKEITHDGS